MYESEGESNNDTANNSTSGKKTRNTDKTMYAHYIKTGVFVIHGTEKKKVEQLRCRYCENIFLYHKVRNLRHLEKAHGFNVNSESFSIDPMGTRAGGQTKVTEANDTQAPRARASSSNHLSDKQPKGSGDPVHKYFEKTNRFVVHGREKKKVEYIKCRYCEESFLSHKVRNIRHLEKNHGYCPETDTFDQERIKPRFSLTEVAGPKKCKETIMRPIHAPLSTRFSSSPSKNQLPIKQTKVINHTLHFDNDKLIKACEALAKVLFLKNIPFNTFEDGTWNEFFSLIAPPFKPPSVKDTVGKYLTHHYNRSMSTAHEALKNMGKITLSIHENKANSKCTFVDMIACVPRPCLLDSVEVANDSLTTSYLETSLTDFLTRQKSQGIEFVALITDDQPHMKSLRESFHQGATLGDGSTIKLLPINCIRRCIDHLIKGIEEIDLVKSKLQLLSSFGTELKKSPDLKRVHHEYSLLCEGKSKGTDNVHRNCRWMYHIDLIAGAIQERSIIQSMFTNKDTSNIDTLLSGKPEYDDLKEDHFWDELTEIHSVIKPLYDLMMMHEKQGATIADAYITMKTFYQGREKLSKLLDRKTGTQIKNKFDESFNSVITEHHEFAAFLHPKYRLSEFNQKTIAGYIKILKSISDRIPLSSDELSQAVKELVDYFAFTSPFDRESFESCTEYSMSAYSWWKAFGAQTHLKKVALVLLSIPAFTSAIEESLSNEAHSIGQIGSKLTPTRVKMLTTVKFNEAYVRRAPEDNKEQVNQREMFNSRSLKVVANDFSNDPVFSDESDDETGDHDTASGDKEDTVVIAVNSDVLGDIIQSTGIEASDSLNYQITLPQGVAVEWENINLRQVDSDDIQMSSQ